MSPEVHVTAPIRLNRASVGQFRAEAGAAVERLPARGRLLVDVAATVHMDSLGALALVTLRRHARARGVDVRLRGAVPEFRDLLVLARLDDLLEPDSGAPASPGLP